MVRLCKIAEIIVVIILVIQIINASPLGLCSCSSCSCLKDNNYCNIMIPPSCSCANCQNRQNSICPNIPYSSCNGYQNTDIYYQPSSNTDHSSCDCNIFPYNTQIPQTFTPLPRCSYSYDADTLSIPCPQTFKNFRYNLQVPVAPRCIPNYGSINGIIDKTVKTNPCPCKSLC